MEVLDKVLGIVKGKGPLLPADIAREINTNQIMAGAMLSELAGKGQIKISTVKVGGSPLYYAPGQEYKLQQYAVKLGGKEKEAYELLKARGVVRDRSLEPVVRVALRAIKDFAKPLEVTIRGETEIFWKWYMLSSEQAGDIIRQQLVPKPAEPAKAEPVAALVEAPKPEVKKPEPEVKKHEIAKPEQKKITEEPKAEKKEEKKPEPKKVPEEQKQIFEDKAIDDPFMNKILANFKRNAVEVLEKKIIKKNSEIDMIIRIPSPVGSLKYYCKAKNKAKPSDSDISAAYVQGHMKKLPVLFIYTGELTKKAKEMLNREFDNLTVKKM